MSNDAERFRVALRLLARERHEKSIIELPTAAVARLISDVSAAYPACRRAFDQEIDAPTTTVERDAVGQNLSDDVMKVSRPTRAELERQAAAAYGFTESQTNHDPLKASMVATQAAFAERDQQRAELDADVMAVAESIGADPSTYAGRVRCFDEMARRGHPRATSRRYVPVV